MTIVLHLLRQRLVATSLWCPTCALPSGIRIELLLTTCPPAPRAMYALLTICTDCSTRLPDEDQA